MRDRGFYATLATDELRRRLALCEDRMERACTNEEWMQDAFTQQEIEAVLQEREGT